MNTDDSVAFEYVLGTLNPSEKQEVSRRLISDPDFQKQVAYWEQYLFTFIDTEDQKAVPENLWSKIEANIQPNTAKASATLPWWRTPALAWGVVAFTLFGWLSSLFIIVNEQSGPAVDYVAVLQNNQGKPQLTAMTQGDDRLMWLQWELKEIPKKQSLQLWAISRSDQQTRSIAVINQSGVAQLKLSDAEWRLIKDADSLILTLEDEGGSVIDEPSERVIATGVCVRLTNNQS